MPPASVHTVQNCPVIFLTPKSPGINGIGIQRMSYASQLLTVFISAVLLIVSWQPIMTSNIGDVKRVERHSKRAIVSGATKLNKKVRFGARTAWPCPRYLVFWSRRALFEQLSLVSILGTYSDQICPPQRHRILLYILNDGSQDWDHNDHHISSMLIL